ncbi:MAG: DegT/DnrJ/EryC1/StrS aminotransferase family protein [Deltaproteobacteria bacterium]|nr:DegT/DnrJ/EryC1/StrS aminotransferase family protein [Deltaproteobacteria bacterium]
MKNIPLIKPYVTEEVKSRVCQVLESGYLTEGSVTRDLEEAMKVFIGCNYAIAVCNCTVGLEVALRSLGVGPGDEVIVPDYTYPATASVVEIVGAKIVIVDVDPRNMLINYEQIEKAITPNTKAIVPVSIFGNPLDYEILKELKQKYGFYILEDAACSLGACYKDKMVGNLADISVFSLHPRKFITTGEGGIITTNNCDCAKWIQSYKHFGMENSSARASTHFGQTGTNYKLSNVQAAIGVAQMKHVKALLNTRIELAMRYTEALSNHRDIGFPSVTPGGLHSYQSYCIFVSNRDSVIRALKERGIETQVGTYALHMHRAFYDNPNCEIRGEMTGSSYAFHHCLTLPLYHDMRKEDQDYVIQELLNAL